MSTLCEDGESAGSAAQVEDSVSILNARLPEQRLFECSLTGSNADHGIIEPRQPAIPQCGNVRVRRCFHLFAQIPLGNTGTKRAILGFLALLPVLSTARFSAPSQATSLLSLHRDARRRPELRHLPPLAAGHRDIFPS